MFSSMDPSLKLLIHLAGRRFLLWRVVVDQERYIQINLLTEGQLKVSGRYTFLDPIQHFILF